MSERLACRVLGQHRSTQRKAPKGRTDDAALTADIVALATEYGRYGYRRITALLRAAGWAVNVKRVERIWRLEGLKVPSKQPRKGRLWLNDGSCVRLRPERPDEEPRRGPTTWTPPRTGFGVRAGRPTWAVGLGFVRLGDGQLGGVCPHRPRHASQ